MKATLHWVPPAHAVEAEVRLYDRLSAVENPGAGDADFLTQMNPASLEVITRAKLEPSLAEALPGSRFQLERLGYFCADADGTSAAPVFNRTVSLKDSWSRVTHEG